MNSKNILKILGAGLFSLVMLSAGRLHAQSATFNITYNTFTPQAKSAFQYATHLWSQILVSGVPIKVNTYFTPLVPGLLGITLPNGVKNFPGAPLADTWYATSLANAISGQELNSGQADMDLYLNSSVNWYFDTTGTPGAGQQDLVSVVLHELCHGLGFLGLENKKGQEGSIGLLQMADFFPITTSFPWPNLDSLPSAFDRLLVNSSGTAITQFANPSNALGTEFSSGKIFLAGANILAANGNKPAKVYAPGSFSLGSSMVHLDEGTYPNGNANELMTPFSSGGVNHYAGPITLAVLKDIGWTLNITGITKLYGSDVTFNVYPNPSTETITISILGQQYNYLLKVTDVTGKLMYCKNISEESTVLNLKEWQSGIYLLSISSANETVVKKIVKY